MKKILNVIKNIFVWLITFSSIGIMIFTVISVNTFDQTHRNLFGYKAFIVKSDSMSATDFSAGDLILTKKVEPSALQEGDIITFTSQNKENYGENVTHKIRSLITDANGKLSFITYGTTTGVNDETVVTYEHVVGKYVMSIPKIGTFFQFLKTTPGYIICIFIPFTLLILYQGIICIQLFQRYKKEQMSELEAERSKIDEERKQSADLMRELNELKKQLAALKKDNLN